MIRVSVPSAVRTDVLTAVCVDEVADRDLVGRLRANLLDVEHIREGFDLHVRETAVQLVLETRGQVHADRVTEAVRAAGYEAPRPVR